MVEENPARDRFKGMSERLEEGLVDEAGNAPASDLVTEVVEAKAAALADAPVQEFVPLLVENQAREELRQRGLTTDWSNIDHGDNEDHVEPRGDGDAV